MLREWTLAKLEIVKDKRRILLRDSLRLLPETDGAIHRFAKVNGFTVIVAATNLVFRELYEKAISAPDTQKLLVIDRAPIRRRSHSSKTNAPPPFYPDFLAETPTDARIDLNLRQFFIEKTGDPNWPQDVNDPLFARLIASRLDAIFRAYDNLRNAHPGRFTDHDFKTIVAFAALGVPDSAFKKLKAEDYWKIGLLGHENLQGLESLAAEVTKPILDELRKAPSPFRWFADHEADLVIRAFYLAVILSQHTDNWKLLLANIDPDLARFNEMNQKFIQDSAPKLVALDREQAHADLEMVEKSLSKQALQLVLLDEIKLNEAEKFSSVIFKEEYSVLVRSHALLLALDDIVSRQPSQADHSTIYNALFPEGRNGAPRFVDTRPSIVWTHLKEAYHLAYQIRSLHEQLVTAMKNLLVKKTEDLTFKFFRTLWNEKRINRLEYDLSSLERLVSSGDFLPRSEDDLPSAFGNALDRIKQQIRKLTEEIHSQLDNLNLRFQEMVVSQYTSWIQEDGDVRLTSQFLRRCLKPHWDSQNEKAVLFIFDGMRYDIWDEYLRPMLEDRMEIIEDYSASSLLPSETHITRKAISAGAYPDEFDVHSSEDKLLKEGLTREFSYSGDVEIIDPEGTGTGETIRYRAGNLDVFIFELCDKELHKIPMKTLQDGRQAPGRPLAFIYQQHLKNIIDTEVMAILRNLSPGVKVFIIADHGFVQVPRERIRLDASWLNEKEDCMYLNARLRQNLSNAKAPGKVKASLWEFPVSDLRMPDSETVKDRNTKQNWQKQYASIVFPKTGYALMRPNAHFNPDAYSHGGISIQELMIPMIVLRVKSMEAGLITLDPISGPSEVPEGEEIEFRMRINRSGKSKGGEIRVDTKAAYSREPDKKPLPSQVLYISSKGTEVAYRFKPDVDEATEEERKNGWMNRTFTITVSYRDGRRTVTKSQTHIFAVQLNSEQIVRRIPSNLGNILGLTPKNMR
ncbi:MAG: PglZ domain-containing protein [Candidatus Omnitrophota bacterium]|jgi:hypothetical protein|nr:MAG: PglZ domain-containing protein [Candidatus Omnitrophota bacterium]